jgi:NAD-dependent SIR2 family protein deacetylase
MPMAERSRRIRTAMYVLPFAKYFMTLLTTERQVDLGGVKYDSFVVPSCKDCESQGIKDSIVKPNVVFFGETISEAVKDRAVHMVAQSTAVLVMGTSLATYSAFR